MFKHFLNGEVSLYVASNFSGKTHVYGVGQLEFGAAIYPDVDTLLGSPFVPSDPTLGYTGETWKYANAEHEAAHLRICETFLGIVSPNHRTLCENLNDETSLLVWRTFEEYLTTAAQVLHNTGELPPHAGITGFPELIAVVSDAANWLKDFRKELQLIAN